MAKYASLAPNMVKWGFLEKILQNAVDVVVLSLLQMIILRILPLANDHPEDPASCK